MFVPGQPSCRWGYRDHVTVLAALLFRAPFCIKRRDILRNVWQFLYMDKEDMFVVIIGCTRSYINTGKLHNIRKLIVVFNYCILMHKMYVILLTFNVYGVTQYTVESTNIPSSFGFRSVLLCRYVEVVRKQ
jgi:hypothetical protein